MAEEWKAYRGAPGEGTFVCRADEVPLGGTHCCEIDGFPLLLVRHGECVVAFVNACPHQFLPLDHKGEKLISTDKTKLRCTNHGAGFCSKTGVGLEGLGVGECLDRVPITVRGDRITIGDETP